MGSGAQRAVLYNWWLFGDSQTAPAGSLNRENCQKAHICSAGVNVSTECSQDFCSSGMLDMTCSEKRSALAVKALKRHVQEPGSLRFPEQCWTSDLSPNVQRILCSLVLLEINKNEVY